MAAQALALRRAVMHRQGRVRGARRLAGLVLALAMLLLAGSGLTACGRTGTPRRFGAVTIRNYDGLVAALRTGLRERRTQITVRFSSSEELMEELEGIAAALMEDALADTGSAVEGDYLRYQQGGYELHYGREAVADGYRYILRLLPAYYTTQEQEAYVDAEIQRIVSELERTEASRTEEERIRAVYDYVTREVAYDRVHQKTPGQHLQSTAYGALYYQMATCQGYAVLTYRLLRELGVETHILTGLAQSGEEWEYHAWELVRVGELYYQLDPTWSVYLGGSEDYTDHMPGEEFTTAEYRARYPMAARCEEGEER